MATTNNIADVSDMLAAARADRLAHTPMWLVIGPGVTGGSRAFDLEEHASGTAARLNREHGLGSHTVRNPSGEVVS
jgi:hypothetical protein